MTGVSALLGIVAGFLMMMTGAILPNHTRLRDTIGTSLMAAEIGMWIVTAFLVAADLFARLVEMASR